MKNRLFLAMTLVVSIGILTACSQGTKETEKPTEAVKATEVAKETEKVTDAVKATEAIKETEKVTDATEETEANTEGYILVETRPVKETEKVTEAIVAETESEVGVVAETEPDTENVDDTWSKEVIISTLQQSFNCTEEDAVKLKLSIELLSDKIKSIVGITKGANPDLNDETYIGFTGVDGNIYNAYIYDKGEKPVLDSIYMIGAENEGSWIYLAWDETGTAVPGKYMAGTEDGKTLVSYLLTTSGTMMSEDGKLLQGRGDAKISVEQPVETEKETESKTSKKK